MLKEDILQRIGRYYEGNIHPPLVVDVPSYESFLQLRKHFEVSNVKELSASDFCIQDEMPQWDILQHALISTQGNWILSGISDFLKLEGKTKLKSYIRSLLDITCVGRGVIVTIGCASYYNYIDPRLKANGRILIMEGEKENMKTLCFLAPGLTEPYAYVDGINHIFDHHKYPDEKVAIVTNHTAADFPESLYDIKDFRTIYQIVKTNWPDFELLDDAFGTKEQWKQVHDLLTTCHTLDIAIVMFGGKDNLHNVFTRFEEMSDFDKWFYLISLKIYGSSENEYLTKAARKSNSVEDFVKHIYSDILDYSPRKSNFQKLYEDRKYLVKHTRQYSDVVSLFCKSLWIKEEYSLYYLTDSSVIEKEACITFLNKYGKSLDRKKIMKALKSVYPELYTYLSEYNYGHRTLNDYFYQYRYCKATNYISEEMYELVEQQASRREYNSILDARSLIVDKIETKDSVLVFMDALGAEYIPYLQNRFFEEGFDLKIAIGRCELPSITSFNKDFIQSFESAGCQVISIKDLDELKHEGGASYDYQKTKLPIHIIKELDIINQLVYYLKNHLEKGKKAVIIGDHGTSRLAVINECENKWEISEKGVHSGRCAPKSEIDERPESATEENDFWCLANYDRFKGGRKGLVEVHGGATLEEVAVPIIEVSKRSKKIACEIKNDGPLQRSIKKPPVLKLFIEKPCDSVSVEILGNRYTSQKSSVEYVHDIELSDIKRPGKYVFNVYCDDILIAKELEVEVVNQGAQEKSFF